jgi:hypothetical protein
LPGKSDFSGAKADSVGSTDINGNNTVEFEAFSIHTIKGWQRNFWNKNNIY